MFIVQRSPLNALSVDFLTYFLAYLALFDALHSLITSCQVSSSPTFLCNPRHTMSAALASQTVRFELCDWNNVTRTV